MKDNNVMIEEAKIRFRNFSGKAGRYTSEGDRSFCVLLEEELANLLKEQGYNVKYLKPLEEDEMPQAYLQVKVSFSNIPPKVVLISSKGQTILTEESINVLDYADLARVDLVIRPYNWEVRGMTGTKAYLKTLYATLNEDPLELKYADVPDSALGSVINK